MANLHVIIKGDLAFFIRRNNKLNFFSVVIVDGTSIKVQGKSNEKPSPSLSTEFFCNSF